MTELEPMWRYLEAFDSDLIDADRGKYDDLMPDRLAQPRTFDDLLRAVKWFQGFGLAVAQVEMTKLETDKLDRALGVAVNETQLLRQELYQRHFSHPRLHFDESDSDPRESLTEAAYFRKPVVGE